MKKDLIRFCSKCSLILFFVLVYFGIKAGNLLYKDKYKNTIPGREIYWAIDKSKKTTAKKKLIIGDSTGNQFFNNQEDDDETYSLACNQAIGMVGHFILLHNFLQAGNRPDTVCLVLRPYSLGNNLDDNFTYHYFLKTMYYNEYKQLMNGTVKSIIHDIPYYWLCHFPTIQTTTWAPKRKHKKREYTFMSPISKDYLIKIDSLSHEYNFKFILVPTIMAESTRNNIRNWNKDEIKGYKEKKLVEHYISRIEYLPDSCFFDGSHLRNPQLYKHIIQNKIKQDKNNGTKI